MPFAFCPLCGSSLVTKEFEGRELATCPNCGYVQWQDPKVVAVAVLAEPCGVWLLRRAIDPGRGQWGLPGGFVNYDEHPSEAARRECMEELGVSVKVGRLLGVEHVFHPQGLDGHSTAVGILILGYMARLLRGRPAVSYEATEVRCFALGTWPELAFTSHRAILERWQRQRGARSPRRVAPSPPVESPA